MAGEALPLLKTPIPGPQSRALARQLHRYESRNVTFISKTWPVFWHRAVGANVWDVDGNRYIDLTAAFGVANAGHANPQVVAAIRHQASKLLHAMGDVHPNELKLKLARELVELTFGRWCSRASARRAGRSSSSTPHRGVATPARVIFGNSGAEAVEIALKTAAIHTQRPGVIAFTGAYHGLTYGALDATHRRDFRWPFAKQLGRFVDHVPFGEVPLVGTTRRVVRRSTGNHGRDGGSSLPNPISHYGAVIVEPIQGRAGIVVPPDNFLADLRRFCDRHGLVLIFDEIYTGFCRTGKWFACEHWNVIPDLICLGKGMTGGFPLSACVGRAEVMDSWPESKGEAIHTSTFLGNPLGCAAALASIAELKRLKLHSRAADIGTYARTHCGTLRGRGLMLGLEVENAPRLCERLLKQGILALPEGDVLGITPPLTITTRQLDYCLDAIAHT